MDTLFQVEYTIDRKWYRFSIRPTTVWSWLSDALLFIIGVMVCLSGLFLLLSGVDRLYPVVILMSSIPFLFYRPIRAYRLYSRSRRLQGADCWLLCIAFGERITIEEGRQTVVLDYAQCCRLTERRDHFLLYSCLGSALVLPKACFTVGKPEAFSMFLQPRLGPGRRGIPPQAWSMLLLLIFLLFVIYFLLRPTLILLVRNIGF